MLVLGLSAFCHDSAAALVQDGMIIAAAEEERFTRRKHDCAFPVHAIRFVLNQARCTGLDLDAIVFYENPQEKLHRMREVARAESGALKNKLMVQMQAWQERVETLPNYIRDTCGYTGKIIYCDQSLSHATATYYASPFEEAAILTVDGVGEKTTTSFHHAKGTAFTPLRTIDYPHSLGLFYAALTTYLGFEAHEGEYKVMGLASYGKPTHMDKMDTLILLHEDGGFELDLSYFTFANDEHLFTQKLIELLGPARLPQDPIDTRHKDIAASLQKKIEESLLHLAHAAQRLTDCSNLCLSGAVGHNVVANTQLKENSGFDNFFVHFACGNNGSAIGAALYGWHLLSAQNTRTIARSGPYLGPSFSDDECLAAIKRAGCPYEQLERDQLLTHTATLIAASRVVGWFQGRMEFGPRALGNRSILASASHPRMKDIINARVKRREEFRPFAPAVLADRAHTFFQFDGESPAMLFAAPVVQNKRDIIPAVTHIDGSARMQTVTREDNPLFYDLIKTYESTTGIPVIINTSFNVRGEPIVCTPDDALNCFLGTDIDALVLGSFVIEKNKME